MSPWQRNEYLPYEPLEVRVSDKNEDDLFCSSYAKAVSHQQETFVQSHTDSKGHQQAHNMDKLREQKHAERAEATPIPDVAQRVSTLAQPTRLHVARLGDNLRRLWVMLQFCGDIKGWLLQCDASRPCCTGHQVLLVAYTALSRQHLI